MGEFLRAVVSAHKFESLLALKTLGELLRQAKLMRTVPRDEVRARDVDAQDVRLKVVSIPLLPFRFASTLPFLEFLI